MLNLTVEVDGTKIKASENLADALEMDVEEISDEGRRGSCWY